LTNFSAMFPQVAWLSSNSNHNKFDMASGVNGYLGYVVRDNTCGYNDFECSQIISTSAKLIVSNTTIALQGRVQDNYPSITGTPGTNFARGIMYV